MMLTLVPDAAPTFAVALWLAVELHPVTTSAAAAATRVAVILFLLRMGDLLLAMGGDGGWGLLICWEPVRRLRSQIRSGELSGPPPEQAVFQPGDAPLGREGDQAHDEHGGPDAVGVEGALGVLDQ